jgi:hypothetical protein
MKPRVKKRCEHSNPIYGGAALLHIFAKFLRFREIQMQLKQHNYSANPEIKAVDFIRTEGKIQPFSN